MADQSHGGSGVFRARLDASGRIVVPAELRYALGVSAGDALLLYPDRAGFHAETPNQALSQVRQFFAALAPEGVDLVGELAADRRAYAGRE